MQGLGCRVQGVGSSQGVHGARFRVMGFRVQGLGLRG